MYSLGGHFHAQQLVVKVMRNTIQAYGCEFKAWLSESTSI